MRPYLVETLVVNSAGVCIRVSNSYPCFKIASTAFKNSKKIPNVKESRFYEQCVTFDRLLDEYIKSK